MNNALIGYTGFVGSTLLRQAEFDYLYRSANIASVVGRSFDCIVCAAAPGQKWIANRDPEADLRNIQALMSHLDRVDCREAFVLISTVDVFKTPTEVDEYSVVDETGLHPYGFHRHLLERFVANRFKSHLIVRLPGLVGPGLRKNVIYDFLNNNRLNLIDSRATFQFYPMVNLWYDIQTALRASLQIVHLTAEPVSVSNVSLKGFGRPFVQVLDATPGHYDITTRHADLFGAKGKYQYSARETIQAIRAYAQSEHVALSRGHNT